MTNSQALPKDLYLFKPFFGSSHWWALGKLINIRPETKVLDIGPGTGVFGSELKGRGVSKLVAVEIDSRMHPELRQVYGEVVTSLEQLKAQKFDLVLMLDVLEHMAEPEKFLASLESFLENDATLLISVPNIAHWSVRFLLLFGFYPQHSRGLLDKTHLQCFTRSRVVGMMESFKNFKVLEYSSTIEPLEFLLPEWCTQNVVFRTTSKIRRFIARVLPGFFAYQHVVAVTVAHNRT